MLKPYLRKAEQLHLQAVLQRMAELDCPQEQRQERKSLVQQVRLVQQGLLERLAQRSDRQVG